MYEYPYGNSQQLNLNWIVSEIIQLRKQLDPDYKEPEFSQLYPYTNFGALNIDWIMAELKRLKELATDEPDTPEIDLEAVGEAFIAQPYDNTQTYQKADYALVDGVLCRALQETSGNFDPNAWRQTTLGEDLSIITRVVETYGNTLNGKAPTDHKSTTTIYGKGDNAYFGHVRLTDETSSEFDKNGGFALTPKAGQELKDSLNAKVLYFTGIACPATTGNFVSYSNSAITANHVVAECVFANPANITTDVTWTTAAGNLTLNGTCSTATTVNVVLVKKDN